MNSKTKINSIQVTINHLPEYKAFRLQGLLEFPEAFGASYEEEIDQPDSFWELRIKENIIFGAFENEKLVGVIHFSHLKPIKVKHRGIIWGMFVDPQWQNKKIGSQLLEHLIEHAKPLVEQLHLMCMTTNDAAIALYKKYGFTLYGTEPKSLFYNDTYLDKYLMVYEYENNS